jgi:GDP-L-fucose synthase
MAQPYSLEGKKIWIAGHNGLVGSAISRNLMERDVCLLKADRSELDLRCQNSVLEWLEINRPDAVVVAAALVGGIIANSTRPAEFLYDNLMIQSNIIHSSFQSGVGKLLFLGSNCVYPKMATQPIRESTLLSAPLEPTNEWYALAKIAGIKLCQAYRRQYTCNFISAMPASAYGPGDNFDLENSHVMAALIRRFHEAKLQGVEALSIWGSGTPLREFIHVDDCASALVFLLENYNEEGPINIGSGQEISIINLAELIKRIVGYDGDIHLDSSKPDGMQRKLLDNSRIHDLGWTSKISLERGIEETYSWFLNNQDHL